MLTPSSPSAVAAWRSPHGRSLPVPEGRTLIMGILNVTPDSFSDGSQLPTPQAVQDRAGRMIAEGADVLDIGGESTRPGAAAVTIEEELARVLPAIDTVRRAWPEIPISIDTYKPEVASAAVGAGADIVNDIWGLTLGLPAPERRAWLDWGKHKFSAEGSPVAPACRPSDPGRPEASATRAASSADAPPQSKNVAESAEPSSEPPLRPTPMAACVASLACPVIVMHNRPDRNYGEFWTELLLDMKLSLALAEAAGVARRQIWLDPGFGFAKDVPQNLAVVRDLRRLVGLGYPVLLGTSRKSTIGRVLNTAVDDRLDGTGATLVWGIQQGCRMVRVHDVAAMRRYVAMADALNRGLAFHS